MTTSERLTTAGARLVILGAAALLGLGSLALPPAHAARAAVAPSSTSPAGVTLDPCSARAYQGHWEASMYDGPAFDSCRAYYPYNNTPAATPEVILAVVQP